MRRADTFTERLFSMRKLGDFVPKPPPLRSIRGMANAKDGQRKRRCRSNKKPRRMKRGTNCGAVAFPFERFLMESARRIAFRFHP
ncbi:hypothetical protein [Paraburkholderia sacchari]|uniref:hypothetical protein n=1 Tax=Paraburkholderia sacchari TaxID=159450 RepID=UPI001BCCF97F|nr:hypothetical protein [Paraburkholderia sacchari]